MASSAHLKSKSLSLGHLANEISCKSVWFISWTYIQNRHIPSYTYVVHIEIDSVHSFSFFHSFIFRIPLKKKQLLVLFLVFCWPRGGPSSNLDPWPIPVECSKEVFSKCRLTPGCLLRIVPKHECNSRHAIVKSRLRAVAARRRSTQGRCHCCSTLGVFVLFFDQIWNHETF